MTAIKEIIHAAAIEGQHSKLDETVLILRYPLQHLLSSVTQADQWRYIDVPIHAAVGLVNPQRDAPPPPFTWRQAALSLDAEGWGPAALKYLEEPLLCRPMPESPGAQRALKLTSYAGAIFCSNGVHRLATAVAWNTRPTSMATLTQAATKLRPEVGERVAAILDLGDAQLEFAHVMAPVPLLELEEIAGQACDLVVRARGGRGKDALAFPSSKDGVVGSPASAAF